MIKFFRTIRQKMLSEPKPAFAAGRFSKYLMYATGEILLVMVGILLALQVNNWNENRKLRINEVSALKEVGLNLDQNIIQQEILLEDDSTLLHNGNKLIDILKDESSIYHDSLDTMFGLVGAYSSSFAIDGAYDNLKQKGLDLIQDENLRQVLIDVFEELLPDIEEGGNAFELEVANRRYDMSLSYFETGETLFSKRPNNFEELKNNQEYLNFLTWSNAAKRLTIHHRNTIIEQTSSAKNVLEEYLEKIDK